MTRRDFFTQSARAAGSLLVPSGLFGGDKAYGGFNMGIQSFSLRKWPFPTAVDITRDLGLHYMETYGSIGITNDHIDYAASALHLKAIRRGMRRRHVRLMAYGVIWGKALRSRELFRFAKTMGLYSISADPEPADFPVLEKLAEEFNINIGIHPHGPGARYPGWKSIAATVRNLHPRIGICMDTGNTTLGGDEPVEGIYALGHRVFGVHLKDMQGEHNVVLGQGTVNIPGVLKALKDVRYKGCLSLEYELEPPADPLPGIRASLAYVRDVLKSI